MAHSVSLSWNADPDAINGYNVYRGTSATLIPTKLTATPIIATTYVDSTAEAGDTWYAVTAVAANNLESVQSNNVEAVILPAAPTGLVITASS